MPAADKGELTATMTTRENSQRTVAIHTHGCKLNQADSQALGRRFRDAGYSLVDLASNPDIIVLNSCTVTGTADAKARQFLRAAKRRNPEATVVATGCYAERAPGDLKRLEAVSLVAGNSAKPGLVDLLQNVPATGPASSHPSTPTVLPDRKSTLYAGESTQAGHPSKAESKAHAGRTRAMVKIQEGCDQVCAYCIVPKVRGRERSIPAEKIVTEINHHSDEGCREVALTGTQLGTYGFDLPGLDLAGLLDRILSETRVERLRVSSLQAHEITGRLLDLWGDTRLMRHFHIPLQSGSDRVLRRMRRRYSTAQFRAAMDMVRDRYPDAGITTDFIAGFPGESDEDFRSSRDFAADMRFADIHVFPYSPRPGTSAFHFGEQVPESEKRERMAEILALSEECRTQFRESQLGKVREVLWEQYSRSGRWTGLTDNYIRVRTESESDIGNRITGARLTGMEGDWVLADIV